MFADGLGLGMAGESTRIVSSGALAAMKIPPVTPALSYRVAEFALG